MKNPKWTAALALTACALLAAPSAQAGASFTFSKSFGAPTMPLNGSTSLSFTINNVTGIPTSGINFTDPLPAGLVVATPNGLTGLCGLGSTVTAVQGSGSVALAGGNLPIGGSCNFSVNVTATSMGVKNNITSNLNSAGPSGPQAIASITVLAALASAASIPTLSEWGLVLLVLAMAASALNAVRRKR